MSTSYSFLDAEADVCPLCGGRWGYETVDGERRTRLISRMNKTCDTVLAHRCPTCRHDWKRKAR